MEIINKKVVDLIPYENNPRFNDEAIKPVAESIKEFGFKVPIIVDKNNVIIAGHTRLEASKMLGLTEVPCVVADDLTDEQVKAFRLADNKVGEIATWDFELLEQELRELTDIDMSKFNFEVPSVDFGDNSYRGGENGKLIEKFIVPPFSILDSRQGYWNKRKEMWTNLVGRSDVGRKDDLLKGFKQLGEKLGLKSNGTSQFDSVLCEIMYKWFNIENGKILDVFAGGHIRGSVAGLLDYNYTGIELRKEQIEVNEKIINKLNIKKNVKYINDDSQNVDNYIENESVDMIFSCPPYFDLEKYSNDERDLSNMTWESFKEVYKNIIEKSCKKLKPNRFAVFVVGEVRNKKGEYINFVDYTKECFINAGLCFYNDLIFVENQTTLAIRCQRNFKNRKVGKCHQNVLVFYKGDVKKIQENYKEIDVSDLLDNSDFNIEIGDE